MSHINAQGVAMEKQDQLPMFCHLLQFAGFLIPLGGIIGPLVLWLMKKDENAEVDRTGRDILSFQISVSLYFLGFFVITMIPLVGWIFALLMIPILVIAAIYLIYLMIKGSIAASKGEQYSYPFQLGFIKDAVDKL